MDESSNISEHYICPICNDIFLDAITTSCGHTFCGECLISYWRRSDQQNKVKCPLDRREVSMMIPNYAIRNEINSKKPPKSPKSSEAVDTQIDEYNHKFAELPRQFNERMREDYFLLRRLIRERPKLQWLILGVIIFAIIYFLTPADLLPDSLGLIGFLDDLLIWLLVFLMFYVMAESYRAWLLFDLRRRRQNSRQ
jgi:RING finger protein 170